ncbi:MAG: hypothetical protein WA701_16955, partial [Solirubrobacterales bacterium]
MRTISAASSIAGAPSGAAFTFGEVHVVIHAESTGGALGVMEEVPPLADTPLHVHANEDELFYALEGEHVVQWAMRSTGLGRARLPSAHAGSRMRSAGSS